MSHRHTDTWVYRQTLHRLYISVVHFIEICHLFTLLGHMSVVHFVWMCVIMILLTSCYDNMCYLPVVHFIEPCIVRLFGSLSSKWHLSVYPCWAFKLSWVFHHMSLKLLQMFSCPDIHMSYRCVIMCMLSGKAFSFHKSFVAVLSHEINMISTKLPLIGPLQMSYILPDLVFFSLHFLSNGDMCHLAKLS